MSGTASEAGTASVARTKDGIPIWGGEAGTFVQYEEAALLWKQSPRPGSRLALRLRDLCVIEGSNPLHGLHVGLELPRDVVIHGLCSSDNSP